MVFEHIAAYWAYLGIFYLLWLTWQDYRNNMRVDDRKNYFMFGISLSLLSHLSRPFWYIIAVFAVTILLGYLLSKLKGLGKGDTNTIVWGFWGFGIIGIYELAIYGGFFIFSTIVYHFFKEKIFKYDKPTPFYAVLLISFLVTVILFGIY